MVSHRKLLIKLDHYGVRGPLKQWIGNFLAERTQRVVVDGVSSKPAPVISGVPQGTCLGPILFLFYINDISNNIQSQLRLFADDALLYRPILTQEDHTTLQNDLLTLERWAQTWDMRFNPKKCYVHSMKHTENKSVHFYSLCNQVLQTVATNPYLGILFSEDMTFTTHIRNICAKASRTLGFLNRNLKGCPEKLKETAYISMCRSVLEYAAPIWDPFYEKEKNQLERIQRKAARVVKGDFKQRSSVTAMMRSLKWEPLAERRTKARLILMYQIINGDVAVPADPKFLQPGRRGRYIQQKHNYQEYKNSFYPRTIRDWNPLPTATKESCSVTAFKGRLQDCCY